MAEQKTLPRLNEDEWSMIVGEFRSRFVKGYPPGWAGTEPTEGDSWVEADEEELMGFFYLKLSQAVQKAKEETLKDVSDKVKTLGISSRSTLDMREDILELIKNLKKET